MMNYALLRGDLSRPDVHPFINLHGISTDHFPIEMLTEELSKVGFA